MLVVDSMSIIIFIVCVIISYTILDNLQLEEIESTYTKLLVSVCIGGVISLLYSSFLSEGSENLLNESFVDAGMKFGTVSGMDSIKNMAEI
jgi:hypothetical protein